MAGGLVRQGAVLVVWVVLAMLVILACAALVATYVAYPRRGQEVPGVPWVGEVLERGVDALPTLDGERSGLRS
jgi:hypothetical protein